MENNVNKSSVVEKLSLLFVIFTLFFIPVALSVSLLPKNIKSKASEIGPTSTPTPIRVNVGATGQTARVGTTTPCGGENQRCCGSIPSCQSISGKVLICYAGYCRVQGTITITPRLPNARPTYYDYMREDTREVGIGTYKPTLTPTPTPSISTTPTITPTVTPILTPISSLHLP